MDGPAVDTELYRAVLDNMSDGVYFVDRCRRITYWSRGAERLTGFTAAEVLGLRCGEGILDHVDEEGRQLCGARCPLKATMVDGGTREAHVYMHHRDGHRHPVWVRSAPLPDAEGRVVGAVEVFGDDSAVAAARARAEEAEALAAQDPLTGLGNRRALEAQVCHRLQQLSDDDRRFGILFVDIDHFKAVNDRHGHAVGDRVLTLVGRTLRHCVRESDSVVRYGGEEFVVVVGDASPTALTATAERLRSLVAVSRLDADGTPVPVTVSIGGTLAAAGDTLASLLDRADAMLYAAKQAGRNTVRIEG